MNKNFVHWFLFCLLSLIWGSSFILMKIGMNNHLSSYQVASLRIIAAGVVLLPVAVTQLRNIPRAKLLLVFLSGTLGSLIPAYLFCIAEEVIDSSLAGTLNCLTPIFVILTGVMFFKVQPPVQKLMGILIAFAGSLLLLLSKEHPNEGKHLFYVSLVIFATFLYGFNVNLVSKYLKEISSFHLAAVALTLNAIPAAIVLFSTGYFSISIGAPGFLIATGAASLLGVVGTAVATVIFYMLVKSAGGIFASMVTYGIPVVAIFWGIYYGEAFGGKDAIALSVILIGVYLANRNLGSPKNSAKKKPSGKEGLYNSV